MEEDVEEDEEESLKNICLHLSERLSVSTLYNCQISGLEQQSLFLVSCCVTSAKIDAVALTVE